MDQNKISELIKKIRLENHFTQKDFADKYHVTYQAVSKWETGKNIPDIEILKQICNDFNIPITDILGGRRKNHKIIIIFCIALVLILCFLLCTLKRHNEFEFKTLSSSCSNFTISGSIAYNHKKSYLYISDVKYCGGDDNTKYKKIECNLYEEKENTKTIFKHYSTEEEMTLEEFLKDLEFQTDECKDLENLYLEINATDENDKITNYQIPLNMNDTCLTSN